MTRATLLRLLAHPTALNGADVRALEELAEAFPYCQTAHLLLAKAAHDHGSMLAGQRLRRAATYATDRTLLRQLIEAAPVEETLEPAAAEAAASEAVAATTSFAAAGRMAAPPAAAPPPPAAPTTPLLLEDKPAQEIGPAPVAPPLAAPQPPPAPTASEAAAASAPSAEAAVPAPAFAPTDFELVTAETTDTPVASAPVSAPEAALPDAPSAEVVAVPGTPEPASELLLVAPEPAAMPAADGEPTSSELPASDEAEPASIEAAAPDTLAHPSVPCEAELIEPEQAAPAEMATTAETDELPAQAPPIRPPAEAEAARQEFGLAAAGPADVMAYQLPELELAITIPLTPANATPRLPAFSGVPDVAYAPGEGSRYGFCLVPVAAETADAVPLVPAAKLPPAGEFFAPDALLLAHLAEPPELPTSSTTDLINSFLQRSTGATRRRGVPTPASPQADLSVRSTRATPDLASESLAKILARQGKTEQAIAVYERLMVKIPEKCTIFAAEIEALRPSA